MFENVIRNAGKFLKNSAFSLSLLSSVFLTNLNAQEPKYPWKFFMEGGMVFEEHSLMYDVSRIPREFRYVPVHPNDGGEINEILNEQNGTIKEKQVSREPYMEGFHLSMGGVKRFDKFDLYLGGEFRYYPSEGMPNLETAVSERNYTNHPGTDIRGEGAALTFYGLANETFGRCKQTDAYSVFVRPAVYFADAGRFFVQYNAEWSHLNLMRGWDRGDNLEVWKYSRLAEILSHNFVAGVNLGLGGPYTFEVDIGYSIPTIIGRTHLGRESVIKTHPNTFFQVKLGARHIFEGKEN